MYDRTKIEEKVNEFCKKGELYDYRDILLKIFEDIVKKGCWIYPVEIFGDEKSSHQINGTCCHIEISLKSNQYSNPLDIIWTILHEFGHHLSGLPNGKEKSIERERQAWDLGQKILNEFPKLKVKEKDFENFRDTCLINYKKYNQQIF